MRCAGGRYSEKSRYRSRDTSWIEQHLGQPFILAGHILANLLGIPWKQGELVWYCACGWSGPESELNADRKKQPWTCPSCRDKWPQMVPDFVFKEGWLWFVY